jgi:uncharacterized protein (TIGR03000 family)
MKKENLESSAALNAGARSLESAVEQNLRGGSQMLRKLSLAIGVPAVALAAMLFAAPVSMARGQHGGGHGGGWGGGHAAAVHGGSWGGYHGGGWGGYRAYYGGYGRGGWGGYWPWYGLGLYGGYYGSYYPGYYAYDYYPSYSMYVYPDIYSYPNYTYQYAAPLTYGANTNSGYYGSLPPATNGTAHIQILVPADAKIWIENQLMTETGSARDYVSPVLTPGQEFVYHIRATWMQNGQPVTQTRNVDVQAGSNVTVNFMVPAGNAGAQVNF